MPSLFALQLFESHEVGEKVVVGYHLRRRPPPDHQVRLQDGQGADLAARETKRFLKECDTTNFETVLLTLFLKQNVYWLLKRFCTHA
jgi:hypothetical protein